MKGLLFTYALTYGGATAALFNPFIGLLVYVCFAIIRPESLWSWSVPQGGNYSRIVALGLLAGWALHGFGRWDFGRATGVVTALLAFWGWMVFSATLAPNPERAWTYVESMSKGLLPCIVAATLIDSVAKLKQLAWVITLSQGYLAYEFNRTYYDGAIIPTEWKFASLDNNSIAITMVTTVGLAFFLGFQARSGWLRATAFASAALAAHVVLFSMSRGGMLALLVTGPVIFVLLPKRPVHYLAFLVALLLVIRLAGPQVLERFGTTFASEDQRDASAESRTELWAACWDAALRNPVTGLGPAHWQLVAHEYGFTPMKAAHTTWLAVAAELGFPGITALLSFYVLCMARLWPLTSERHEGIDPELRPLACAVIASLTGFIISAQFVAIEGVEMPYYLGIIGAGILMLLLRPEPEAGEETPAPDVPGEPDESGWSPDSTIEGPLLR